MNSYKLIAPDIDRLLRYFDDRHMNPSVPTPALTAAMEPLFSALADLAPLEKTEEAKTIWLQIPRGTIDDYDSYEDLVEYGEVETREEYEARWLEDYPSEVKWYRLVIVESIKKKVFPVFEQYRWITKRSSALSWIGMTNPLRSILKKLLYPFAI